MTLSLLPTAGPDDDAPAHPLDAVLNPGVMSTASIYAPRQIMQSARAEIRRLSRFHRLTEWEVWSLFFLSITDATKTFDEFVDQYIAARESIAS